MCIISSSVEASSDVISYCFFFGFSFICSGCDFGGAIDVGDGCDDSFLSFSSSSANKRLASANFFDYFQVQYFAFFFWPYQQIA